MPEVKRYTGPHDCEISFITICRALDQTIIVKVIPTGERSLFDSEFFKQYNSKTNLGLENLLEIVQHFFAENSSPSFTERNKEEAIAECREGILSGVINNDSILVFTALDVFPELLEIQEKLRSELGDDANIKFIRMRKEDLGQE